MRSRNARAVQATVVGDSDASVEACHAAERIGAMLASHGITLVTGGRTGVMEAAGRGACQAGGTVVGILPSTDKEDANPWCNIVIPTGLGHARNVLTVLSGDFLIVLGGAAGTLSEICFAWIHEKPILTLRGFNGWADKLAGSGLDHRQTSTIMECASLEELENAVLKICQELGVKG